MTPELLEVWRASQALQNWFKSQDISPSDSVVIAEMFVARMVVANGTSSTDIEEKFELFNDTIREFTTFCLLVRK